MIVGAVTETYPGERRVALVPSVVAALVKQGLKVVIQAGAGLRAGYPDSQYSDKGAEIVVSRSEVFAKADILIQVRCLGANLHAGREDLSHFRSGQIIIGMCDPLGEPAAIREIAATGATLFALELVPRITRAQAMDVLSSMATIVGYRAVIDGAGELPRLLPMITYAAGMIRPAKVFIVGVGVAGLRAIATAKQLGAQVQAHDIRPTSREEAQSVGAKFVELPIEGPTQDAGGYARQLTEDDYRRQRELIAKVCAESDLVITTAAIPGRKSPLLITADAVRGMQPGSVIVDLGAERGGNCELTKADERSVQHGVTILGPTNLASEVPYHASEMFANNVLKFLATIVKKGELKVDRTDEVVGGTLAALGGEVTNDRIRTMLGMPVTPKAEASLTSSASPTGATETKP